jgi:hypothetical protein
MNSRPPRRIPQPPKEDFQFKKKDEKFIPWFKKNGSQGFGLLFASIWLIAAIVGFIYSNFLSPNRNSSPPKPKPTYVSQEQLDWQAQEDAYLEQQRIEKIKEDAWADMEYDEFREQFYADNGYYP